jgi:ABC-type transport system involved in Fe-S cluster assembly fused permease/ATPase subunit
MASNGHGKPRGISSKEEKTPLLKKQEEEDERKKNSLKNFSRWKDSSSDQNKGSKKGSHGLLVLQFSLILLLGMDLISLLSVAFFTLRGLFFTKDWLLNPNTVQWRYWGAPVIATLVKLKLFALSMWKPRSTLAATLCYLWSSGFLILLAIDSFKLDAFKEEEEEANLLMDANIANSLPLIFTVLEMVNLNYLRDSFAKPLSSENLDEPTAEAKPQGISFFKMVYILKPYFWPHGFHNKVRACSTYLILVISKLANLAAPLYMAKSTNALVAKDTSSAIINVTIFCSLTLLSKIFKELQSLIYLKVKQTAYIELATLTYEHVHTLSYDWHVRKKLGDVLRSMDRGVESANSMVSYVFLYLLPTLAESVVVIIIFAVHFQLASLSFIAFTSLVVYAFLTIKITLWRKKFRTASNKHDNEYHDKATDALINYETIKYFSNEKYEIDIYKKIIEKYQSYSISVQASLSLLNGSQAFVIQATTLGALALAIPHVVHGKPSGRSLDIGAFIAISVYLNNLFQPLFFLGTIYNMVITSVVDMQKLSELLSVEPDVVDHPDAKELVIQTSEQENGISVAFEHVYFHYPSQEESTGLIDMNFSIPKGTTTAFVGETGAGKTTISRLLFRFYECNSGRILINEQDISKVTQHSLRRSIGIVPQDTVLFNDTILENIKYGNLNATFDQIVEAAKNARIYDFIMKLPDQWNTKVGERGLKLSGGEKQRVAIARTLLKDPPFVILDEATSALDTVTEKEIQAALARLQSNRTMMIIAHRLSTIRHAEQILVLLHGQVAERGTHDELLTKHGIYHRMWNAQLKLEQNGDDDDDDDDEKGKN